MTDAESKRLYRIMDFSRVVQIFERQELFFANPSIWDDPYEQRIKHSKYHALFAQCWCKSSVSDAMWRIYSQNGMGVRISTTVSKLRETMRAAVKDKGYKYRLKEVSYKTQKDFEAETGRIVSELSGRFNISRAGDMLYMKREAFSHENEWRAMLYQPNDGLVKGSKGVTIPVDPHKFIDRIILDPRAPDALVSAFEFYFKERLGFEGDVRRSSLYKMPEPFEIDEEIISVNDL